MSSNNNETSKNGEDKAGAAAGATGATGASATTGASGTTNTPGSSNSSNPPGSSSSPGSGTMTFSSAALGGGVNDFPISPPSAESKAIGADISELQRSIEEAKSKAEENWNLFVRTRADMDNYRRRAEQDVDNARKFGLERFAKELIAVIDSLEQGLSIAETAHDTAYKEGMQLTLKLLLDIFDKFGITRIEPKIGDAFDHNKNEAISMQATKEMEPNKIILVAQKGFILNDRVLRAARVVVSKAE